jgi:16S rRNA (uracil1498-N3)-methyltransferase
MASHDFTATRLFLRVGIVAGSTCSLDRNQANYLVNVLRLSDGASIVVFNGEDGEWRATLRGGGRKVWSLEFGEQLRPQPAAPDLHYIFAPLKQARQDYMVQKAVEMGAGRLRPVLTQHGQIGKVNVERMESNAVEAAEQCGILTLPVIDEPVRLRDLLDAWPGREGNRRLIFCDEGEAAADPLAILAGIGPAPLAVLIGPEGGFSEEERLVLRSRPFVTALPLGPRILRADTAAVAALALVQAALGDWKSAAPASR